MIKFFSNLFGRSSTVKNETVDLANTATRVGSLFEDLTRASPLKWDASGLYVAGQVTYFLDLRCECVVDTFAGESPLTAPLKWSVRAATDGSQISSTTHLPVLASAVWQYIDSYDAATRAPIPNATPTTRGLARQSTDEESNDGDINDAYITPRQQKSQLTALLDQFIKPTIQSVLMSGNLATLDILLKNANYKLIRGTLKQFAGTLVYDEGDLNNPALAIGLNPYDIFQLQVKGTDILGAAKDRITLYPALLDAAQTRLYGQRLSTAANPIAVNPLGVMTIEPDPLTGGFDLKSQLPADNFWMGFNAVDKVRLAAILGPLIVSTPLKNDLRIPIGNYFCRQEDSQILPTYTFQNITVTNPVDGQIVAHRLNRSDLVVSSQSNNNVDITVGTTSVTLNMPTGQDALALPEFFFKLESKNAVGNN